MDSRGEAPGFESKEWMEGAGLTYLLCYNITILTLG